MTMSTHDIEFEFDRAPSYTVDELCEICQLTLERILELVDYGVIHPVGSSSADWRFPVQAILQARRALRLQRDLELNLAGIALAQELIDENERLRRQLQVARALLGRFMH
jgi:chaperone modulatory protein CbpM